MEEKEVEQEAADPQPESENQQQEIVQADPKEEVIEKSKTEINWEAAQNVLRLQKQQIEELTARLNAQKPSEPEEHDDLADLEPSDYVTVEKAQKLAEKKARAAAKQIVGEYMQQQNLTNDEARMRTKCPDYDYVIENFAVPLIKNDPALAYKIQTSRNPAETAYRLGKLADNYEEPMKTKENTQKAEKIIKNSSRPVSGNSLGAPLKGQADEVLKMSPKDIWEQSQKYARGA